jgi:hypothetical protein
MGIVSLKHELWVPLHAKNLWVPSQDDGFDQSVR